MFGRLVTQILHPRIDDEKLREVLAQARERMPPPVIWLFGKTQSGKTSLIRTLTGRSDAEIGNGFRACTKTARMYAFPNETLCLIRFLDTRGLGEVNYDPTEDLAWLAEQSHLMIVVMKALDPAQKTVLESLEKVRQRQPRTPLVVAQTCLHEGYPPGLATHPSPYPYDESPIPETAPVDVRRALVHQREWFLRHKGASAPHFVALDFTQPEDGYTPIDYGIDALWRAIEDVLPHGLQSLLRSDAQAMRQLHDIHFEKARPQIIAHSVAAGMAAAVPFPIVDIAGSLAVVGKMFHALSGLYKQPLSAGLVSELVGCLGIGFTLRIAGREAIKTVPFAGSLVAVASGVYMAACTYALGLTLCYYFSHAQQGAVPDSAALRNVYGAAYQEGIEKFRDYLKSSEKPT
ncbi:hypothetical protein Pla175_29420 [Pirellulimonas nuda]|uniref:G domain-containing protein n=1 Tax=Pirellulimonas nuda TaxID=2528009 RepID=A0A518DDK2_9BACT|nr:DUF697 domain-containing protein [Pirellulimonas nuda]QDU89550.1 hypothetical protein Pla175_29420 [Pirellulimonas nuda]